MNWHLLAACRDADPELFFPTRGEESGAAREYCARCPVAEECLAYAMRTPDLQGVWAGTSQRQRERMRRKKRVSA